MARPRLAEAAGHSGGVVAAARCQGRDEHVHRLVVTGDLSIHGVTRQVDVDVEAREAEGGWLMRGEFRIRLSDYDILDPSIFINKVKDEVVVWFEIRFGVDAP